MAILKISVRDIIIGDIIVFDEGSKFAYVFDVDVGSGSSVVTIENEVVWIFPIWDTVSVIRDNNFKSFL